MNTYGLIRELVQQRGMSVSELERKLKLSNGSISKWDKSSPNSKPLTKVANYLNVTTDYLLGLSNSPTGKSADTELERAIDNARSFDGKPISDKDREKVKNILRGYFED